MNNRRNASRLLEKKITHAGVPHRGDQVPTLESYVNEDYAPVNPPPFTDENIRTALFQMAQGITIQAQASSTLAQAMTAQGNKKVIPQHHQQVATVASLLCDFTRTNPPTFYRPMLSTYQHKDVAHAWCVPWKNNRPSKGGHVTWEVF